jgi:LuxR family transcriptional regulator, maltose regulon positive regulatory protein
LLRELDAVCAHRLTLVSASAGSGKTTLLSAWAAARGAGASRGEEAGHRVVQRAFAWLSLDALDTEPTRFWTSVIAALRTNLPMIGQTALALLHSQEAPPLSTILTALLYELEQMGTDIILILDDYHVISDQSIHESILFLLDHLPANLHLVLATRTDPALPLSRFRVHGQLLEIRDQDLRFSRAETTSFLLQGMGLPLSEEEVAILETRTEGCNWRRSPCASARIFPLLSENLLGVTGTSWITCNRTFSRSCQPLCWTFCCRQRSYPA